MEGLAARLSALAFWGFLVAVNVLLAVLPNTWIESGGGVVSQLFAPVRNIGALFAALVLLVLTVIWRVLR